MNGKKSKSGNRTTSYVLIWGIPTLLVAAIYFAAKDRGDEIMSALGRLFIDGSDNSYQDTFYFLCFSFGCIAIVFLLMRSIRLMNEFLGGDDRLFQGSGKLYATRGMLGPALFAVMFMVVRIDHGRLISPYLAIPTFTLVIFVFLVIKAKQLNFNSSPSNQEERREDNA